MHLNLGIGYGVLFALVLGLVQLLLAQGADPLVALRVGMVGGFFAGILVSVVVGFRQWRAAVTARDRRVAADPTASPTVDTGVRAEQTVRVPLSRAEVLHRAPEVAESLGNARVRAVDEAAGPVTPATTTTGWSWGERVVLTAGGEDGGHTTVTVASRPRVWGVFTDGGANAGNVERVAAWLRELPRDGRRAAG